jgi:hypothetical protein
VITRYYVTLSFLTTAGCALEVRGPPSLLARLCKLCRRYWRRAGGGLPTSSTIHHRRLTTSPNHAPPPPTPQIITPFNVYFNTNLIFRKGEVWRLLTNFFFFGSLGLDFVFHMFFLVKYCKSLEEGARAAGGVLLQLARGSRRGRGC